MRIDSKEMKYYFANDIKHEQMPRIVYHYCSLQTFLSIMTNSTIRLFNIAKSNDSEEITYIVPFLLKSINKTLGFFNRHVSEDYYISKESIENAINSYFNELSKNFYVACFSEEKNLLSQWVQYSNDACGVAIGFNTDNFIELQIAPYTGYVFGNVIYDVKLIQEKIVNMIESTFTQRYIPENDAHNQNIMISTIRNVISTMLYYSILYKNPGFSQEKEWRLIYNPFGRIRRITDKFNFFDRMNESSIYGTSQIGFIRKEIQFTTAKKDMSIATFFDLDFSQIKKELIREIIIGPQSYLSADDKDLLILLKREGYDISHIGLDNTIKITKSQIPYNNNK